MYLFSNLKRPRHTTPGVSEKVLLALVEWFIEGGIKGPGPVLVKGDEVLVKDTHEFILGKGFIECRLAPEKNKYDANTIGDTGFQKFENKINVVIPGSYAELHDTMKDFLNKPIIALIKDSDCPWNTYYQIGTNCVYAYLSPAFGTGTTKEGIKGYTVEIVNTANKVFLYQGGIPNSPEPIVARINGSIAGTTVTIDALESTIFGMMQYEYTVVWNDNDDVQHTFILPDNSFEATFDTSILTDWNNAGFGVILKITNEFMNDITITSDSIGERPLHMGGFDEGFDDGFDFNN